MKKSVLSIDEPEPRKAIRADRPPTEGFATIVDGHVKSEFDPVEAAVTSGRELKSAYPRLQIEFMTPPIRSARCWASGLDYLVPGIALARQDTTHIFLDGSVRVVAPSLKIGVFKCQAYLPETPSTPCRYWSSQGFMDTLNSAGSAGRRGGRCPADRERGVPVESMSS
jgi:hypothetical protein